MTVWHWVGIGVAIFLLIAWLTKGRVFRVFGDILEGIGSALD